MLCNDPGLFSIVISTKDRPAYVRRSVDFLKAQGFRGGLLVVDASAEGPFRATADYLAGVGDMHIRHFAPQIVGNNWIETVEGCGSIQSKYIFWHHDDDFYFLDAIERSLQALSAEDSAACAQGREVFLTARRSGDNIGIRLTLSPRFGYAGARPLDRLREILKAYCHLPFAVMRRETFIDACRWTARYLKQGWFDQYACSALLAVQGSVLLSDDLYGVRQRHAANHSNLLADDSKWPLIAANPRFSELFAAFKSCLVDALARSGHGNRGEAERAIDEGLTFLIARQYDAGQPPDDVDRGLIEKCYKPGTPENARVASIVQALARHPETV
jgi:glycosyltransferase domain-containing protein